MQIGLDDEFIVIDEIAAEANAVPDLEDILVFVKVKLKEFSGIYNSICISKSDIASFVGGLEQLGKGGPGNAVLNSFNRNEFLLEIRSREDHKNISVEVSLSRYQYSGPVEWNTSISGGFELDPESVPSLLNSFKNLIPA